MGFLVNGKKVFAGTGSKPFAIEKPVIIFLHGSGLDHTFWDSHAHFFASCDYAVLVPDLPGHSNSAGPALKSIESIADWLNDVVAALDINDISLVAHSQGSLVALEFAARYPQKLRSVSLIASGLATPVNPALIDTAENNPEAAIAMMTSWSFDPAGHVHQENMWSNGSDELVTDLKACDTYQNGKIAAAKISGPVQVILGGQDRMAPHKVTQELVDHLADPEVHVIPESGHMVPLEAPDFCLDLLKNFIFANNPAAQTQ
jgi:pimeloyl-ACP methyl ester carboxylesterase